MFIQLLQALHFHKVATNNYQNYQTYSNRKILRMCNKTSVLLFCLGTFKQQLKTLFLGKAE